MLYILQVHLIWDKDQDVPLTHYNETKTVSVGAFYMDQTEITNNEYRQFVNWVRDSIARRILGQEFPEEFLIETYDDELEVKDEADWQLNGIHVLNLFPLIHLEVIILNMPHY